MNEEIKVLAQKTVDKIYRKIKRARIKDFHKFGVNIGVGADGTPTKYIDKIAEDVAINFIKKSIACFYRCECLIKSKRMYVNRKIFL